MDTTYDPEHPWGMGPDARGKRYRDAGWERPRLVEARSHYQDVRVDEATAALVGDFWSPYRYDVNALWDKVEAGEWGAVAIAAYRGTPIEFMDDDPAENHVCHRLEARANREVMLEMLQNKARVMPLPELSWDAGRPVRGERVPTKVRTWQVRGPYLYYDPTHTRTARGVQELLDALGYGLVISDDYLNDLEHESTEALVEEHIREELAGSVLESNESLFEAVREKIFEQVASWCPQCHPIDRTAAEVLSELGAKRCYGCEHWFGPHEHGEGQFVCPLCTKAGVELEKAVQARKDRVVAEIGTAPLGPVADLVAELMTPQMFTPEFGEHKRTEQARYLYGKALSLLEPLVRPTEKAQL